MNKLFISQNRGGVGPIITFTFGGNSYYSEGESKLVYYDYNNNEHVLKTWNKAYIIDFTVNIPKNIIPITNLITFTEILSAFLEACSKIHWFLGSVAGRTREGESDRLCEQRAAFECGQSEATAAEWRCEGGNGQGHWNRHGQWCDWRKLQQTG